MKAVAAVLRTDLAHSLSGLIKLYVVMSRSARRDLRIFFSCQFALSSCQVIPSRNKLVVMAIPCNGKLVMVYPM